MKNDIQFGSNLEWALAKQRAEVLLNVIADGIFPNLHKLLNRLCLVLVEPELVFIYNTLLYHLAGFFRAATGIFWVN